MPNWSSVFPVILSRAANCRRGFSTVFWQLVAPGSYIVASKDSMNASYGNMGDGFSDRLVTVLQRWTRLNPDTDSDSKLSAGTAQRNANRQATQKTRIYYHTPLT